MKTIAISLLQSALLLIALTSNALAKSLDIYFIDVEGGQATLLVTPRGESLLIDTGFPGNGTQLKPGNPKEARDANRILAAARDAGIERIDYLLITHFHVDHMGGLPELAQLIPIKTFIDHGGILPEAETSVPGTTEAFKAYAAVRSKGRHLEPKPSEKLPLKSVEALVVSSSAVTLNKPLAGAGENNTACSPSARPAGDSSENPRSTGIVVTHGKFRFLDVGDLSGTPLFNLVCPKDLIGPVDVYLVAHHGGNDVADPATFAAFKPRAVIMNNGLKKGGALSTYELLQQVQQPDDVWQLHRSEAAGKANFADAQIANLDESTSHWIKLSAEEDGSFEVLNGRTGKSKRYPAR